MSITNFYLLGKKLALPKQPLHSELCAGIFYIVSFITQAIMKIQAECFHFREGNQVLERIKYKPMSSAFVKDVIVAVQPLSRV